MKNHMGHRHPERDALHVSYGAVEILPIRDQSRRDLRCCRTCQPSAGARCCCNGDVAAHCKSVVFLVAHAVFAWCVGLVLLACVALSMVLLPLCGLGVLVFSLLFSMGIIDFFAKCDAALVNYVVPPQDQIQIDSLASQEGAHGDQVLPLDYMDCGPPERLISGLSSVSTESSMVLMYLVSIKLVLATIGLAVASMVLVLPWLLVDNLLWGRGFLVGASSSGWEAMCAYTAIVLVFLVAVMSMDLVVGLCSATTRFFCCERVYTMPIPGPRATAPTASFAASTVASSSSSRPNVVVVRIPPSSTCIYTFASSVATTSGSSAVSAPST